MYTASGKKDQKSMLEEYLPLVHKQASKLRMGLPSSVEMDDLIQAGVAGLLEAIARFDPKKGHAFANFASVRIHGAMVDELRVGDWLPRSVRRSGRHMAEAMRVLEQKLGRAPTELEVAEHLGMDLEEYRKLLLDTNCGIMKPFEDMVEERGEPAAPGSDIDGIINAVGGEQEKAALMSAIMELPEREQQLLALYYQEEMTLKEIGAVFEVSEVRICQLHSQAINRLRGKLIDSEAAIS